MEKKGGKPFRGKNSAWEKMGARRDGGGGVEKKIGEKNVKFPRGLKGGVRKTVSGETGNERGGKNREKREIISTRIQRAREDDPKKRLKWKGRETR